MGDFPDFENDSDFPTLKLEREDKLQAFRGNLTVKEFKFVQAMVENGGHQEKAVKAAGYEFETSMEASAVAWQLMQKPHIQEELNSYRALRTMGAQDILYQLTKIARTTLEDFYDIDEAGTPTLNLNKAQEAQALGLVKAIKEGRYGTQIELYDRMKALELLGKHHGLFVEVVREDSWYSAAIRDVQNRRVDFKDLVAAFQDRPLVIQIFRDARVPLPAEVQEELDTADDIIDGNFTSG